MTGSQEDRSPSELIDGRIAELGDWRGELLGRLRALVKDADPDVVEEWKWRGVSVWEHAGIICTGETYKSVVKMTFARGAALEDPRRGGVEGARSRRRDAERLGASGRPPRPPPEGTEGSLKKRLRRPTGLSAGALRRGMARLSCLPGGVGLTQATRKSDI